MRHWNLQRAGFGCVLAIVALAGCGAGVGEGTHTKRQTLARLENRPLHVPSLPSDGNCPFSTTLSTSEIAGAPAEAGLGPGKTSKQGMHRLRSGPVYAVLPAVPRLLNPIPDFRSHDYAVRWPGSDILFVSRPSYRGPLLVRGAELGGAHRLGFGPAAAPSLQFEQPAGPWQERERPRVHIGNTVVQPAPDEGWRIAVATVRIRHSGCYAFQVDGQGFGYLLVFESVVNPPRPA